MGSTIAAFLLVLGSLVFGDPAKGASPTHDGSDALLRGADRDVAEFWFVEANEGQSAGGHAALRLGPRVYHLEHRGDGLIADRRTSPRRFTEIYADRGNRRIEAIPLDLDVDEKHDLARRLASRLFDRTQRLAKLDALEDEIRWLEGVRFDGAISVEIPGLGLFAPTPPGRRCWDASVEAHTHRAGGGAGAALRSRIVARYGEARLRAQQRLARAEVRRRIATLLRPDGDGEEQDSLLAATAPGGPVRRLMQAAQTEAALEILLGCERPLLPGALVRSGSPVGPDRPAWTRAQLQLEREIEALLASPRPDVGLPLLLAWARALAIEQTLASDQIHVLAPFQERRSDASSAFTKSTAAVEGEVPPGWNAQRRREAEARWHRALSTFSEEDGPLEARLLGIERAHHTLRHIEARTLHDPVRPESRSPSRAEGYASARRVLPWPSGTPFSVLDEVRAARQAAAAPLRRTLSNELGYDLFTRNCVTELSAALNTLGERGAGDAERGKGRNGRVLPFGRDDARLSATQVMRGEFIPELVALRIEEERATEERRALASARERALDAARQEYPYALGRLALASREFITLTSQTYQPNQDDSRFLFFSDGPVAMRPLIGLANLAYGTAGTLLGLLEAPFDRGVGLRRGAQGIAMSVPELFFFQVRRGSYRVTPPRALALAPSAGSTETR